MIKVVNKFVLGAGSDGIYSDITIEIRKTEVAKLIRGQNIELKDEEILKSIEREIEYNWIDPYRKNGIYLEIIILNVGIDPIGRKYAAKNSVAGVMQMALPKIGINPPQIFGL